MWYAFTEHDETDERIAVVTIDKQDERDDEGASQAGASVSPGRLSVTVYNADAGGPPEYVQAGPGEKVGKVVEEALAAIEVTATPGDRLVCLANGSNVRDYADMHLKDYAAGQCGDLVWSYSRDTGGA